MDAVVLHQHFLKLSKNYLNLVGILPGQSRSHQYFVRTVICVLMISALMGKILHFIYFFDIGDFMDQLSCFTTLVMALVKYAAHIVKRSKFKVLLDGMVKDLETDKTEEELAVMVPYIDRAVFMSTLYAYAAIACMLLLVQMPFMPLIADIIMPLNTSRPRLYMFPIYYYFVDMDDTFYWGTVHVDIVIILVTCGSIACDSFYICTVQHACGLFAVAGYRFKDAIQHESHVQKVSKTSNEMYRRVCHSIMAHDRALRHVRDIDDFYYVILFIAIGLTVLAFSCTLFWLTRLEAATQLYTQIIFSVIELSHLLFLSIQGQFVNNRADNFYNEICEGLWYNSVPRTQTLFVLALRSALDPPQITAGGFFTMNLQTFAEIVKLSFSYCTVMQSV